MGTRLKVLREQKKMSQTRLALELGMTQNSISRFETGVRKPDFDTLIMLADYFDVSIDYLVERSDDPRRY